MSAGYASRLKEYPNKGKCGLPELSETRRSLATKINRLADLMKDRRVVVLTGAGISTSTGIPDFRGPNGIWTKEKQSSRGASANNKPRKRARTNTEKDEVTAAPTIDFSSAKPSLTHRIITKLTAVGAVRFCVTQNVDGLHQRSGMPRKRLAVLHGCVFTEKCEDCQTEHFRDVDVGGMSFQKTGRKCERCQGDLRDVLLDWEDELPREDFERATKECSEADLVICLGTSLRIEPAGSLPTLGKKFVIVNLQETPYDSRAEICIRARVDEVMQGVMECLGYDDWEKDYDDPPIERLFSLSENSKRKDDS